MLKVNTEALEIASERMNSLYARISDDTDQLTLIQNRLSLSSNQMDQYIERLENDKSDLRRMGQTILHLMKVLHQCSALYNEAEIIAHRVDGDNHYSGKAYMENQKLIQTHEFEKHYEGLIEPLVVPNIRR